MIDKSKNHTYVITIHYWTLNGEGMMNRQSKRFTSNHGIVTKQFKNFLDKKINEIKNFHSLDEEWGEQYTVPLNDFCS